MVQPLATQRGSRLASGSTSDFFWISRPKPSEYDSAIWMRGGAPASSASWVSRASTHATDGCGCASPRVRCYANRS
ncbi:MAG TPA: hypothetical protein VFF06_17630 [Polyangia bacterium]|nr:hypothetical protein [Polyangia bacterium]